MFCTSCGKNIPDGSVFCPECGASLGAAPAAPVAAVAKKGLNKKTIIIIAAVALALIVGLILILVLTSTKHRIKGTWVRKVSDNVTMTYVFKAGGKGEMKRSYEDYDGDKKVDTTDFKWEVKSKNKLVIKVLDDDGDVMYKQNFKYNKKLAKDPDKADEDDDNIYWCIDGKKLYINGDKFTKK